MFYRDQREAGGLAQEVLAQEEKEKGLPDSAHKSYVENLPNGSEMPLLTAKMDRIIGVWQSVTVEVSGVHNLKVMTYLTF